MDSARPGVKAGGRKSAASAENKTTPPTIAPKAKNHNNAAADLVLPNEAIGSSINGNKTPAAIQIKMSPMIVSIDQEGKRRAASLHERLVGNLAPFLGF